MRTLATDFKQAFLDRVYGHVDDSQIDRYLEEYIFSLETANPPESVWQQFSSVKEIIDDFKRFVEFAEDCDYIEL